MKYIYFEMDNLSLFIDWLREQPSGRYIVMIGRDEAIETGSVANLVSHENPESAEWLKQKRIHEEIILTMTSKLNVPQGLAV